MYSYDSRNDNYGDLIIVTKGKFSELIHKSRMYVDLELRSAHNKTTPLNPRSSKRPYPSLEVSHKGTLKYCLIYLVKTVKTILIEIKPFIVCIIPIKFYVYA